MVEISGVYEVAIKVSNLEQAEAFYTDVLGLKVGLRDEARRWIFLRAGGLNGLVVLQEDRGEWPKQHFAFTASEDGIDRAVDELQKKGVAIAGPMVHDWIPAKSLYFADPDGHDLELCATLGSTRT